MKKMKALRLIFLLTFIITLTHVCKTLKNPTSKSEKDVDVAFFVFQDDREILINNDAEAVELERAEFSLRFYNKRYNPEEKGFYSTQIAAFLNKSELDKIKFGMSKSELAFFEPGSGMAPAKSGKYEMLIFKSSGHHYTFYEDSESKRLKLLDESGELLKLEFEIAALYLNGEEVQMEDTNLSEFYTAVLIDRNLNGIIDKGELLKLTVQLK
jgi:hypothetical protein